MDSLNDGDVSCASSWSSAANWTVAGGCLENTVAYESFYSPINEEETVDSGPKSPLVLRRSSPESGPCEITLRFAVKHEIRQVYVRSTARVFEMYYATNSQNENEYFCTVRCGAALRDEEVLHMNDIEGVSAHINGSNGDVAEAKSQRGSNVNTNEDDWVQVKAPDGLTLDLKSNSSTSNGADSVRIKQDFYEATAEISEANPCTSLTIRLLSLQDKNILYVDEVYVFANPVDFEEDDPVENSAQSSQSSLMSMLVPTLLQLSKTTGSSKSNGGRASNAEGIDLLPNVGLKALDSTNGVNVHQQEGKSCATVDDEVKLLEKNESDRSVPPPEVPPQVPKEGTHDAPLHRIENILGQLVFRMDRIENYFLRFEENMLRPINSIEGRLKQVEQQLEVLAKESHGSEWPSCYRMSAPSFSANESGANSFYNSGNDHPSCGPLEPDREEFHSGTPPIAPDISNLVGSLLLRPSLVVTAPEFSNGDEDDHESVVVTAPEFSNVNGDGQESTVPEVAVDSSKSKPKLSIDDVLASALAQFALSSSSIGTPEHSKTVAVRPPDLLNEDENNHKRSLSSDLSENEIDHRSCSQGIDNTQCTEKPSTNGGNLNPSPSRRDYSSKSTDGDDEQVLKSRECKYESTDDDVGVALAEQSVKGMEEHRNVEVIDETSEYCVTEKSIPMHPLPKNEPDKTDVDVVTDTDTVDVKKESCDIDIVHDVLGFSRDRSVVNFQISILDVSFTSMTNASSDNTLKDLLGDIAESSYGESGLNESDGVTPVREQYDDLILVEEEEAHENGTKTNGPISVDMNYYTIMSEPLIADGEILQDYCNNTVISSLI